MSDAALEARIGEIHAASYGTYGAPRIHAELRAEGMAMGRKRVARLMRRAGLTGISRRKRVRTTIRDRKSRPAPDLVERDFEAEEPNRLWVADLTYVPTRTVFLYLAIVLDAFSRRIVGWAMATHLRAELVLEALDMAWRNAGPRASSTIPTRARSTPPSLSVSAARKWASAPPWVRWAMPTTTPWQRASLPPGSAS